MASLDFIIERLSAISKMLNAIGTNAKKIDELPAQTYLDLASRIHVSRSGISERITLGQIIDAVENDNFDEIVSVGNPVIVYNETKALNEVIVPTTPIPTWRINNVYYSKTTETKLEIPFTGAGLSRIDILIVNNLNDILIIQGEESAGIAVPPQKPLDTIVLSQIFVTDIAVGEPSVPVDVSNKLDRGGYIGTAMDFIEKREGVTVFIDTDSQTVVDVINLPDQRSVVDLSGSVTDIKSASLNANYARDGKPFYIKNKTDHNIKIWHNAAGVMNRKFYFPNELDFALKPNEIAQFIHNISNSRIEYVGADTSKQDISNQIEVPLPATVSNLWHGKTVIFTSTGTLTVPSTLATSFIFNGITLTGVTLSWAITSPKTWLFGTPIPITEKQIFTLTQRGSTNSIMLLPVQ